MSKWFLVLQLGSYVLAWFQRAAMDGRITTAEILELITGAVDLSGLKIRIDVPELVQSDQSVTGGKFSSS